MPPLTFFNLKKIDKSVNPFYLYTVIKMIKQTLKTKAMIALRFTRTLDETGFTSEDQVNKKQFAGLCAYDISDAVSELVNKDYSFEEAVSICALRQVEFDNWHAHNTDGKFVVFEGKFIEFERDNQDFTGNRAVLVDIKSYYGHGQIDMKSEWYKIKYIEC